MITETQYPVLKLGLSSLPPEQHTARYLLQPESKLLQSAVDACSTHAVIISQLLSRLNDLEQRLHALEKEEPNGRR